MNAEMSRNWLRSIRVSGVVLVKLVLLLGRRNSG
jgi:hypothetical protein